MKNLIKRPTTPGDRSDAASLGPWMEDEEIRLPHPKKIELPRLRFPNLSFA